jgi:hypothetical protein
VPRRLPSLLAAVAAVFLLLGVVALPASGAAGARTVPRVRLAVHTVDLHARYDALLPSEHRHLHRIAITYARGHRAGAAAGTAPATASSTCTEPNCPLAYHQGQVETAPKLYLLLWGPDWSTTGADTQYLSSFLSGLGVEPADNWSTILEQYSGSNGRPAFSGDMLQGVYQDTTVPPIGATQTDLQTEADSFYHAQALTDPVNTQIIVATQTGTCPAGFAGLHCAGTPTYCAYHTNGSYGETWTNLPYLPDAGGNCGQNMVNSGSAGTYDGYSIVEGHEFAETVSDPTPSSGWIDLNDPYGGEVGDKCAWAGEPWGGNDPIGDVALSSGSFAMQSLWSNATDSCLLTNAPVWVSVNKSGTGRASIASSPSGISCGATCSVKLVPGTKVKLTAKPAAGTVFNGWSGPCSGIASKTCSFTVKAKVTIGARLTTGKLYQEWNAWFGKGWTKGTCSCYSGGATRYSTRYGSTAKFTFTGSFIEFVSERTSNRGAFAVYLDGRRVSTVNLHSSVPQNAVDVWQHSFGARGTHTLKIVNLASAGHPRIDVDAFVVAG